MLRTAITKMDESWDASNNRHQAGASVKGSLMFIMNAVDVSVAESKWMNHYQDEQSVVDLAGFSPSSLETKCHLSVSPAPTTKAPAKRGSKNEVRRPLTYDEKRRSRECRVDGCENYIINKGLCFRHGGGKKCSVEDCRASAKNAGLCWRHGGSVKCTIEGCLRRGKSRGLCWTHGGGTRCASSNCTKVAVSNGHCWAHGGGKRCAYDGCRKAAYERTHNYCVKHHDQLKDGKETLNI